MAKTIRWSIGDKVENVEIRIGEAVLKKAFVLVDIRELCNSRKPDYKG